ncbi:hypothetical protein C8J56DRAFT_155573 [Mycena floridula]|nr:hypothetical protein C8J56DRAFT_155573 [Mycena floridula]
MSAATQDASPGPVYLECSTSGCTQPVDLILKSCDGSLIGAHRCNMSRFSDGFPSPDTVTGSIEDIVTLEETEAVLKLLLEFLHPQILPSCTNLDFNTLIALASAAEKYLVYSAMLLCNVRLSESRFYEAQPAKVLCYAVRHRYSELADTVAPLALKVKLKDVHDASDGDLSFFAAWALYHEQAGGASSDDGGQAAYTNAVKVLTTCPWLCCTDIGTLILAECPWPTTVSAFSVAYVRHTCASCRGTTWSSQYPIIQNMVFGATKPANPSRFSAFYKI